MASPIDMMLKSALGIDPAEIKKQVELAAEYLRKLETWAVAQAKNTEVSLKNLNEKLERVAEGQLSIASFVSDTHKLTLDIHERTCGGGTLPAGPCQSVDPELREFGDE